MNKFDLKNFRENVLKETQESLAVRLGVKQDYISRLEKNPDAIPLDLLFNLAFTTGMTMDQIVNFKKPEVSPLIIYDTREKIRYYKGNILKYIEGKFKQLENVIDDEEFNKVKKEITTILEDTGKKPVVGVFGMSDAGKSALINALLGMEKMPVSWTPMTTISVYIKHISERPTFIEEEGWIFKSENEADWNYQRLYDEDYCKEWKLAAGTTHMLKQYGTREGENSNEAGAAIVFLDSDILKLCDLVDLPGFGTGDRESDDYLPENVRQQVDIVLYLSLANGFLRDTDIAFLERILKDLKPMEIGRNELNPLNNLFVIASQSHYINNGNQSELQNILQKGCERFYGRFPDMFWNARAKLVGKNHSIQDVLKRFYTYTTDIPLLREKFESDFSKLLEILPRVTEDNIAEAMNKLVSNKSDEYLNIIEGFNKLINDREKAKDEYKSLIENEPRRIENNSNSIKEVKKTINSLTNDSKKEFLTYYNEHINIEHIIDVIKLKGYKKKKSDIEDLCSYLSNELELSKNNIMNSKVKDLNAAVNEYIEKFEKTFTDIKINLNKVSIPFNILGAFAGGLAGTATLGGLALWASTLGNLGSYILVAKGVSLLSALGISVGGTATAATAISAIGGPIVLGITLAVIIGVSAWAVVTGNWEKRIAKKIVDAYANNRACDKYIKVIEEFWTDTNKEFDAMSKNLDTEYKKYLEGLGEIINKSDIKEVENKLKKAEDMKAFFDEMPLLD
jgi:GTP-binding protein EngB required for normal cell division/esterase/lipase